MLGEDRNTVCIPLFSLLTDFTQNDVCYDINSIAVSMVGFQRVQSLCNGTICCANNTLVTLSLMMKFDFLLMVSAPVVSATQRSADTYRSSDSDSSHRIHNIEDILQTISSDDNVSSSNHSEGQGHMPGQGHSLSQLSEQSSSPSRAGELTQGRSTRC